MVDGPNPLVPRKRAKARLAPVPDEKPDMKGENSPPRKFKASGRKIGINRANNMLKEVKNAGPDMPPGKALPWLPTAEEVPPKPTEAPEMEWPGVGHMFAGHPEWQLRTYFLPGAQELFRNKQPYVERREWEVRWVPPDDRRCKARTVGKLSEWMGNQCTSRAIKGGKVCITHGGNLPNVRKAAKAALATAALPAAERLIHIALKKKGVTDADRIKAIVQILDRAGVEGRSTVEVDVPVFQQVMERAYAVATGEPLRRDEVEGVDFELLDEDEEDYDSGE